MICAVPPTPLSALPAVPIVCVVWLGSPNLIWSPCVTRRRSGRPRFRQVGGALHGAPVSPFGGSVPDPRRGTERGVHRCDGVRAQPPRVELTPSYPAEACLIRPPWWSASEASFSRWIGPPPSRPLADGPHGQAWRSGPVGP